MSEILAPVGSYEMLVAAVRSGADAVYLGASDFNARRNAQNFSEEELKQAIEYCHICGVKVYLTLNTVLRQKELETAIECAKQAAEFGVDAFIIADLGIAKLLKEALPEIPLHASTQMTVHSLAALPLLKKMGFSRVVLSREMDKKSITEFCKKAKELSIETELFIHGALCMCMSGQCYLSSVLGGRSGNRGICAQPCRLPFTVQNGTGHDLSLKDLSLMDYLEELSKIGVDSFKIEGRMKRPEYVAAAVTTAKGVLGKKDVAKLRLDLQQIFSRSGFTDGYYTDKTGKNMFGIRTKEDVKNTASVYRNLHELYRAELQTVPLSLKAELFKEATKLTVSDGINTVVVTGLGAEEAINKPADYDYLYRTLTKFGGTPYYCESFEAEIGEGLTTSASGLNALRREAVEELSATRSKAKPVKYNKLELAKPSKRIKQPQLLLQFAKVERIPENLPKNATVILPIETDFSKITLSSPVWAHMPRGILNNEKKYSELLQQAKQNGIKTVLCGTLSAMSLCLENGLEPFADFSFNVMNNYSVEQLKSLGATGVVLSFENTLKTAELISNEILTALITYGHLPLMLTRNCPNRNGEGCNACGGEAEMTDRKGESFKIVCRNGFSELLNGIPLYMGDRQKETEICDYHLLRFTTENVNEVSEVLGLYLNGKPYPKQYTRGLYYKDII